MQQSYSAFFREERTFYTLKEVVQNFGLNPESEQDRKTVVEVLKDLIGNQIVVYGKRKKARTDNLNDKNESDVEIISDFVDSTDEKQDKSKGYVFNFVGIASVKNFIFYIYPKYIRYKNEDNKDNSTKFIKPIAVNPESPAEEETKALSEYEKIKNKLNEHFKSVMKVINYFAKDNFIQPLTFYNNPEKETDPVSFMVFMLQQYYEHGLYYKEETVIETNGDGEIDWDRTINETSPIIQNNIPYYVELKTIQKREDTVNIIRNLHMAILSECSQYLKDMGIIDYIGVSPVYFDWRKVSDVGSVEYLKKLIHSELQVQNANIQKVQLYNMLHYLGEEDKASYSKVINIYGTRTFQTIWEKVLKANFDDLYDNDRHYEYTELGNTRNPEFKYLAKFFSKESPLGKYFDNNTDDVSGILGKSQWEKITEEGSLPFAATKGLIPDTVTFFSDQKTDKVFLLDAKYYLIDENGTSINHQPPTPDISKQYIYEALLRKRIFNVEVLNYFVIPRPIDFSEEEKKSTSIFLYEYIADYENIRVLFHTNPEKKLKCISLDPEAAYSYFIQRVSLLKEFSEFSSRLEEAKSNKETEALPAHILLCHCKEEDLKDKTYTYNFSYDDSNSPNSNLYLCHFVLFKDDEKPYLYAHINSFYTVNNEKENTVQMTLQFEENLEIPDFLIEADLEKLVNDSGGNMFLKDGAPKVLDIKDMKKY